MNVGMTAIMAVSPTVYPTVYIRTNIRLYSDMAGGCVRVDLRGSYVVNALTGILRILCACYTLALAPAIRILCGI